MCEQKTNESLVMVFHISAFSTTKILQFLLSLLLLLLYLIVVFGNVVILTLVSIVSQLQTSMYFFLCNLAVLDILYVSTILPKLLYISFTGDHALSYNACITQLYLFLFFADTESFLLGTMAFDRFTAICFPLHYSVIMSKKNCVLLALPAWCMAAINAFMLTCFVRSLTFTGFCKVNNFFCDLKALIVISASDTKFLRKFIFVDGTFIGGVPVLLILNSYICIIITILKIKTSGGRAKTFSSCTSHITIVALYYGSAFCLYMQYSPELDKLLSIMFVTLVPMLNPIVYTLRNRDIKQALQKIIASIKYTA
ncbi:olfactory receptor 5V1-like [Gastrophryne carolinensis]